MSMSLKAGVGRALRDLHEAHARRAWAEKQRAFERAVELLARAFERGAHGSRNARPWMRAQFGGVTLHAWSRLNAGDKLLGLAEEAGLAYLSSYELVGRRAWARARQRVQEAA